MTKITPVRQKTNNSIFFSLNQSDHKIHLNVTKNTFFVYLKWLKITYVRQNTNNSIFLFLNQK